MLENISLGILYKDWTCCELCSGCPVTVYIIYHLSIILSLAGAQDQEKHHFALKIATASLRSRLH